MASETSSHPERDDWGQCTSESCTRSVAIKKWGLCNSCYRRRNFVRGKSVGLDFDRAKSEFWCRVSRGSDQECWLWTGAPHKHGHGVYVQSNVSYPAYRVAYLLAYGPLTPGMVVDHKCRNRLCVNPAHLQQVTSKGNAENVGIRKTNLSGFRGVSYREDVKRWRARVGHNNRVITIGHYSSAEEANAAVVAARLALHTNNLEDRGWTVVSD